jgi:DNA-binding transcriptional ArsR family regulator
LSFKDEIRETIKKQVESISKKYEIFSNPIRILIISVVLAEGETNWSRLKENIEKIIGSSLNPNTLGFHVGKLVEASFIEKTGTREQTVYKIAEINASDIEANIEPALVENVKEKVLA